MNLKESDYIRLKKEKLLAFQQIKYIFTFSVYKKFTDF